MEKYIYQNYITIKGNYKELSELLNAIKADTLIEYLNNLNPDVSLTESENMNTLDSEDFEIYDNELSFYCYSYESTERIVDILISIGFEIELVFYEPKILVYGFFSDWKKEIFNFECIEHLPDYITDVFQILPEELG